MKKVIILRGVQGSGKTTWAEIQKQTWEAKVVSADDLFTDEHGVYKFDPSQLSRAHAECLKDFLDLVHPNFCISCDYDRQESNYPAEFIIVDNTNTTVAEIAPYYAIAQAYGYEVEILTFVVPVEVAATRNIHGVPLTVIERAQQNIMAAVFPPYWVKERVMTQGD